jgi:hypothetical protein
VYWTPALIEQETRTLHSLHALHQRCVSASTISQRSAEPIVRMEPSVVRVADAVSIAIAIDTSAAHSPHEAAEQRSGATGACQCGEQGTGRHR